jgi:multidrug efflux pump subunit AcrB
MNIAEFAITKKTVTLVICVMIIIGGILSFNNMGRLEDPEFVIKDAIVVTLYPGATPMEVAEEVTDTIETEIQQLPQLKEITSLSKAGISVIQVSIKEKYGRRALPQIWDELRRRVGDAQMKLPPGVYPPIVNDNFGDVYGILLAITGDGFTYEELKAYVKYLRKELLLVKDVAKIEIWGLQKEAVFVEISRYKLANLGIGPDVIYQALTAKNFVLPSGSVRVGPEYIRIHPTGGFLSIEDIGNLQIRDILSDRVIYLKDVATVSKGYISPPDKILRYNGKQAISVGVSVVSGGNVVALGKAIQQKLDQLKGNTPIGIELGVINFQSHDVTKAVNGFVVNFIEAIVIVVVVLLIFMGIRTGLIIGVILALTVLASLIIMYMLGINLQRISLGALIIALGMLVDNAIVVSEGMLVRIEQGMNRLKAAREVVEQCLIPLFGATVIAVLAFSAIGLSTDSTGEYCRSLFLVILISLMISWVIAVTVTPLFCSMFIKPLASKDKDPYQGIIFTVYKKILQSCMRWRLATVCGLIILLLCAILGFGTLKNSFFPPSTRPQFMLTYWLPAGTDIRQTSADLAAIEKHLLSDRRIVSTASYIGSGASRFMLAFSPDTSMSASYGRMLIRVKDYKYIPILIPELNQYLAKNFPDAEPNIQQFMLGPPVGYDVEVRFSGPDPSKLRELSETAQAIMREHPDVTVVRDNWRQKVKVLRPVFKETQARLAGITKSDLSNSLQLSFSGLQIGVFREGDELRPIIARPPESERLDVDNINNLHIWSAITRQSVPVNQIVSDFKTEWEDSLIHRKNRKLTITTQCNARFGILGSTVFEDLKQDIESIALPPNYEMVWGGEYESSTDAKAGLAKTIPISFLLMILIVIMLFNNLRQPLIIWLVVPLAIIGVSLGLFVFDLPFDFMAILGFLSLVGMLIKGAIVLIDQINIELESGKAPYPAIMDSAVSRMRPVCMSAVTTVLGMLPLLQDPFFISMAVTIMFGLTFATILTLVVVPVFYCIFYRVRQGNSSIY